jgi:hypothetical protein
MNLINSIFFIAGCAGVGWILGIILPWWISIPIAVYILFHFENWTTE